MAIDVETVRKVANLAQIREPDARLEALAGELSGILKWIEQLDEVTRHLAGTVAHEGFVRVSHAAVVENERGILVALLVAVF